jgi:RND family efflux transporter MFP subunit
MFEGARATASHWPRGLPRPAAPWKVVNAFLVVAVAASGVTAYFVLGKQRAAQAQVTTGTVQRGSVLSTVSASGNVQPAETLSLSFSGSGGKLVAVYVKAGDHVRKSQPLAKLDDSAEVAAVRTARANLVSAQANLASLEQPLTPATRRQNQVAVDQAKSGVANQQTALKDTVAGAEQDRKTLRKAVQDAAASASQNRQTLQKAVDQARVALTQAQQAAKANATSLRNAVGEAKGAWLEAKASATRDLANLQAAIDQAKAQLERDQAQLAADQNDVSTYTSQVASATDTVTGLQAQVDADKAQVAADQKKQHSDNCDQTPAPQPKCANDAFKLSQDQSKLSDDQARLSSAQSDLNAAQSKLDAATSAVSADQAKIVSDQTAITNAESALATGQLKDAQSVNQAYRAYVNAQASQKSGLGSNRQSVQNASNALKNALQSLDAGALKDRQALQSARQSLAAGAVKDQQSVHNAKASLKSAQQSLESTLAANAAKEESATPGQLASARAQIASARAALQNAISAEKQMTLVAPAAGTIASIDGAVGESPGGGTSSAASSSSAAAFITLVDLDRPEVLANFSESDAARIRVGQTATITVDALPNKQLAAHVVSIDTTQTVVSNVVTYGVTFVLDRTAPDIKPGMTVSASVIVAKRDGVLHVPNAAVHTTGGASFVTVVGSDGTRTEQPVQTGLVGDDSTEIVGGLKAGQEIVVSTLTSSLTSTSPTGGRGNGGGGVFRFPGALAG